MKAYIQNINITSDNKVLVKGQLSRGGLQANLVPRIYVTEPEDGIYEYELHITALSAIGTMALKPFEVESAWTGGEDANGIRIIQLHLPKDDNNYQTTLIKTKKVSAFTKAQLNNTRLIAAFFEKETRHLTVKVSYSGGCLEHSYAMEWDGKTLKSNPPQYVLNLVDISELDPCRSIKEEDVIVDINNADVHIQLPCTVHIHNPKTDFKVSVELN